MRVFTRSRDAAAYMQMLERMVLVMAEDIANLLNTEDASIRPYDVSEIIDDYSFVISEPSVMEELLHEQYGTPYLERESHLACLVRQGATIQFDFTK